METLVAIKDLAAELGIDRSNLRRFAIKHGFNMPKMRTAESRNQLTLAFTIEDAEAIRQLRRGFVKDAQRPVINGTGLFYIVQLIPEFDPTRIKFGYTENLQGRLNAHRTSAPTVGLLESWPARRHWESTAIDSITREDCENIASEVFECGNLEDLVERADAFFLIMPSLERS